MVMPRYQRRISSSGVYHVMIRGNEKKEIFFENNDRKKFIEILSIKKRENQFELYSYCLMDNHVHLIINELNDSIAHIMKSINVSYVFYFNKKYRRVGHLFQDRFKSEVIENDAYLLSATRYIHRNPVKAGIVDSPNAYEWSSFTEYVDLKNTNKLTDTEFILNMLSENREIALEKFINFSSSSTDDKNFIDVEEDSEINTREDAVNFVISYLSNKGIVYEDVRKEKRKIKGTVKHDLIKELHIRSNLSSREIGEVLGLSKSTVNNLISST